MPISISYNPIFDLVSSARIKSFEQAFGITEPHELYGAYIWSQNASASIYPLMQHLEIVLRNSIDKEARARFGDFWWKTIQKDNTKPNHKSFLSNIKKAEEKLKNAWEKAERARLGIKKPQPLPATSICPAFSHDDILASTDFSTWQFILVDAYSSTTSATNNQYLWPQSLSKAFRRYSLFDSKPNKAREDILNAIMEVRDYRNRLFHHDCIWIKSKCTLLDERSIIDTIRNKINLIAKLIEAISPLTHQTLTKWGLYENAKRVCSVNEFRIYTKFDHTRTPKAEDTLNSLANEVKSENKTLTLAMPDSILALYTLR
jgi:hypothetical protein